VKTVAGKNKEGEKEHVKETEGKVKKKVKYI